MNEIISRNFSFLLGIILVILATVTVAFLVNRFFVRFIRRTAARTGTDPTNYQFLRHVIVGLIYVVGFSMIIYMIPRLRAVAGSLLAGAGLLAVVVGFASQAALSNIVAGFFIVIFKPFRVNDRITIKDTMVGIVEDITLRHTVIRNFENRRIIIPNSVISNEILVNANFGEEKTCKWIDVGISYDSDIDLAKKIMAEEVGNHPYFVDYRSPEDVEKGDPKVVVRVLALGESSVNMRAWAWTKNTPDSFGLGCDVYESIKKRFDREGVEIPFPHRTVVHKNKVFSNEKTDS